MRRSWKPLIVLAALLVPAGAAADPARAALRLSNDTVFDWFAHARPENATPRDRRQIRLVVGRGGWVCSPAGFARRSACRSR